MFWEMVEKRYYFYYVNNENDICLCFLELMVGMFENNF